MKPRQWTIKELIETTARYFKEKGVESPRLTAELLLSHTLGLDRLTLYLHFDQPLTDSELSRYRTLVGRRVKGEPVQYITGVKEFWSMEFKVDPRVLIPRPETEVLMEKALSILGEMLKAGKERPAVLDLGTGCGAIAVVISKEFPRALVWATDISPDALEVAKMNAHRHGVKERLVFRCGDLCDALDESAPRFDLIVSNPPYVAHEELACLPPEIREHEPTIALDGGRNGLAVIERIIQEAPLHLTKEGWLALEMDPRQCDRALELLEAKGKYKGWEKVKDYQGRFRVLVAQVR